MTFNKVEVKLSDGVTSCDICCIRVTGKICCFKWKVKFRIERLQNFYYPELLFCIWYILNQYFDKDICNSKWKSFELKNSWFRCIFTCWIQISHKHDPLALLYSLKDTFSIRREFVFGFWLTCQLSKHNSHLSVCRLWT